MSSYEYLEFVAVERALDAAAQQEMRRISSRGTITSHGYVNEYHYGDFKGDAIAWMERWFDAHVRSSSWEHCELMLRVPMVTVSEAALAEFAGTPVRSTPSPKRGGARDPSAFRSRAPFPFQAFAARGHASEWILRWAFWNEDDPGEHERFWNEEDGPQWMPRLLPLREELLRGDRRPLYLGWLARVAAGEIEEDDAEALEPELPPGLNDLSAAQQALVEFLLIDPDWLAAAAAPSAALTDTDEADEIARFVDERSTDELRATARLLLAGERAEAERELRGRWFEWLADASADAGDAPPARRSVADIAATLDEVRTARLDKERRARDRAERARKKKRAKHLDGVLERTEERWQAIEALLQRGTSSAYDEALKATRELHEAMVHGGREAEFRKDFERSLERHARRQAWRRRLVRAGLIER